MDVAMDVMDRSLAASNFHRIADGQGFRIKGGISMKFASLFSSTRKSPHGHPFRVSASNCLGWKCQGFLLHA